MVEIFKTNIDNAVLAAYLTQQLLARFPGLRINFDLDDRDNILRVEGPSVCIDEIVQVMATSGYSCHPLE